jgi:hypothetical protein
MFWFWLNMPLAAACFLAWCAIPLWMVLKHPSWGPEPADGHVSKPAAPAPVAADEATQLAGSADRSLAA